MRAINGDRLGLAMQIRGLTHAELATKAGISQAAISNAIAGGKVRPSTLKAIAKALHDTPVVEGVDIIAEEQLS